MIRWMMVALTSLLFAFSTPLSAAPRDKKAEKRANTRLLRWFMLSLDQSQLEFLKRSQKDSLKREKMMELGKQIAQKLPDASRDEFVSSLDKYSKTLSAQVSEDVLYQQYQNMRLATYKHFKVARIPSQNPSLTLGAEVYKAHCSTCHGVNGRGDGVLAQNKKFPMKPGPGDLQMLGEQGYRSPVSYHNTLLLGSPGTSMPSFAKRLSNHEAWSVAFYLVSDQFWGVEQHGSTKSASSLKMSEKLPARFLSLEFLATRSDTDMRLEFEKSGISDLRNQINILRNRELERLSVPRKSFVK